MQYVYLVEYGKDRVEGQKDKLVGRRNFCFEGTQNWRIGAVLLGGVSDLTKLLFKGDAKLARERGLAGVRISGMTELLFRGDAELAHRRGSAGGVSDLTELLFKGDAELARSGDSAGGVFEFVGRMIYDTSRSESHKQSL